MYRIKNWIPVEIEAEEDMQYITIEEAEKEKAHLELMQRENIYKIEEVESGTIQSDNTGAKLQVASVCPNCGAEVVLTRLTDHKAVGICDGCGCKIEERTSKTIACCWWRAKETGGHNCYLPENKRCPLEEEKSVIEECEEE